MRWPPHASGCVNVSFGVRGSAYASGPFRSRIVGPRLESYINNKYVQNLCSRISKFLQVSRPFSIFLLHNSSEYTHEQVDIFKPIRHQAELLKYYFFHFCFENNIFCLFYFFSFFYLSTQSLSSLLTFCLSFCRVNCSFL